MAPVMIGLSILSFAQGMSAASKQKSAAAEAERMGREKAARIEAETAEQKRREKLMQEQVEGGATARAAASGVQLTGSTAQALTSLYEEHKRQLDFLDLSGRMRAREAVSEGRAAGAAGRAQAKQTQFNAFASAVGGIYGAGRNQGWWGVPSTTTSKPIF